MSEKTTTVAKPVEKVPAAGEHERPVYAPRSDIYERDDAFVLIADMPGVSEKTVDVHFEQRLLTISGEVVAPEVEGWELAWSEYRPGAYRRTFAVGEGIDAERITASVKHGVLTVVLPKRSELRPRKIEVKLS